MGRARGINAPRECVSLLFRLFETYLLRYPQMRLDITTESRLIDIVSEGLTRASVLPSPSRRI